MRIILYILILLSCAFLFKCKKSNDKIFFKILLFVCLFLFIFKTATKIPDSENYLFDYNDTYINKTNPLFALMNQFFYKLGFPYALYKGIFYVFGYSVILISLRKLDMNVYLAFFLYLISIFFVDVIQFRNFCGTVFLIGGVALLLKGSIKNKLLYLVFLAIATAFHNSFLVYLIFLCPLPKKKKYKKFFIGTYFFLVSLIFAFFFFNKGLVLELFLKFSFIDSQKFDTYSSTITKSGSLIVFGSQLFTIVMLYACGKKINPQNAKQKDLLCLILYLNVFALCFSILAIIDLNFYRLIRNLVLINLGSLTIFLKYTKKSINFPRFAAFCYPILWIAINFVLLHSFNSILLPFFK